MILCPTDGLNRGVVELCPNSTARAKYFTEVIINGNLHIPEQKPPKQHIVKTARLVEITCMDVIDVIPPGSTTPIGRKIFVAGMVTLGIQYVADTPDQKVHFVHFDVPFSAIIQGDCGALIPVADTIFPDDFVVHVCVEKMRFTQVDNRTISKELVLLVWVEEKL